MRRWFASWCYFASDIAWELGRLIDPSSGSIAVLSNVDIDRMLKGKPRRR
jgi:hypothetical protein